MKGADNAACRQCGEMATLLFEARDIHRKVTDESFAYYRCGNCRLVFVWPVPANLARYYPPNYHPIPRSLEELLQGKQHEDFKLQAIGQGGRGRRLLEIGPSYGRFAALAKRAGFDVRAIEMDPDCCRFLENVVGIPVHLSADVRGTLAGLERFDVIALWHSLEHLPDPWSVLDALPAHLERGGSVAITTPNPQSSQFRLFGSHWVHLDAPRHLTLIPHTVLESRLAKYGMRRAHFSSRDQGALDCNLLGWFASSMTFLPQWMQRKPFTSVAWRLSRVFAKLDERDPYGSAYTIVFSKP